MPRTKQRPKPRPRPVANAQSAREVLTLAEAGEYLRLPELEVLRLIHEQGLPARQVGSEWRFLKTAIQQWLSKPPPRYSKEAQLAAGGALKDDPDLETMVEEIYRRRGRPITEDGSYKLFHGLNRGTKNK